jgi:hypothetical protein
MQKPINNDESTPHLILIRLLPIAIIIVGIVLIVLLAQVVK